MKSGSRKSFYQDSVVGILLFLLATFISTACSESDCNCDGIPCSPEAKTVKEVKDEVGTVGFDTVNNQWLIIVSIDGTYDSQDVGMVCNDLAEEYQEEGKRVVFSGQYKEYSGERKPPFPGQVYYYLFISNIKNPQDE